MDTEILDSQTQRSTAMKPVKMRKNRTRFWVALPSTVLPKMPINDDNPKIKMAGSINRSKEGGQR